MKKYIKFLIIISPIFFVMSCKHRKSREEGQRRINDSEITIYSNKDINDLILYAVLNVFVRNRLPFFL